MKTLPGNGSDHLKATYEEQPTDFSHSIGVQGTFWTEHVATPDVMEFLALPRLIAVGEARLVTSIEEELQLVCAAHARRQYDVELWWLQLRPCLSQ